MKVQKGLPNEMMINVCFIVPPPPPPACFPSSARVNLENGKSVTMSQLQKGDKVETGKTCFCSYI